MVATRALHREALHVFDFIPEAQHAAIIARTSSYDVAPDVQDAIDEAAAAGGGKVFLPSGKFVLGASLVPKRGVSIEGVYPGVTPTDGASWDLGWDVSTGTVITFPGGVVFAQDMSGGNGTLSALDGVMLRNLGFDNVASIVTAGGTNKSGLCGSVIENIIASDVTGLAFDLINPMHIHMTNVKAARAYQLLKLTSDYDTDVVSHQPGNSYFADLYGYITAAGHGEGSIHLQAIDRNSRGTPLNYCHFDRVQVNRFGSTSKTGYHLFLEGADISTTINGCGFRGLDFEGYSDKKIRLERAYHNHLEFKGFSSSVSNADFYVRNSTNNEIHNIDDNAVLDIDTSVNPLLFFGVLASHVSSQRPLGIWQDKTKGGGAQFGTGISQESWNFATPSAPVLPLVSLDLASGGGLRPRRTSWNSASTLTLNVSTLGLVEVSYVGATTVVLPDATTCPRMETEIKKTGASGTVTVNTQLSQTIDGSAASNTYLDTQYKWMVLRSNGSNWIIVGKG